MVKIIPYHECLAVPADGSESKMWPAGQIADIEESRAEYMVGMNDAVYAPTPVENTTPPTLDVLTAIPGDIITCSVGVWTGEEPITYEGIWDADGVDIAGATTIQYTVQASDVDKAIGCRVRATSVNGEKLLVNCVAPCLVSAPITRASKAVKK